MHGLRRDFDGGFMEGRSLEFVAFSENTVTLHFDQRLNITILGAFSYRGVRSEVPVRSSDLMTLLGTSVKRAAPELDGSLRLEFDTGDVIIVHETGPWYESFHIQHGESLIVV